MSKAIEKLEAGAETRWCNPAENHPRINAWPVPHATGRLLSGPRKSA
jgi:hypothetical protein